MNEAKVTSFSENQTVSLTERLLPEMIYDLESVCKAISIAQQYSSSNKFTNVSLKPEMAMAIRMMLQDVIARVKTCEIDLCIQRGSMDELSVKLKSFICG